MGQVGIARSGKVEIFAMETIQLLIEPMVSLLTRHAAAVAEEFANPAAKMQLTTGMIPTGLLTIVTGMLEMLVLVRGMDTILKTKGTPQRQHAVLVVEVILESGMLFVQADELLKMI
jgi:hypothetical protein